MVTNRDRAIVEWIGRLGAASAADVMARFGMGRTATYRRLAALVDQGVLATERLLHGQPALYVATRYGLQWARLARLDTCGVSDAMDRLGLSGAVQGLRPMWPCPRTVGRVVTVKLARVDPERPARPSGGQPARHLGTAAVEGR